MAIQSFETEKGQYNEGRWTKEEHDAFVEGLQLYGKEWKKIAALIPTRSIVQVRTHAQKFFQKVARTKFERKGIQVPDALKSTAIKGSYNFKALQQALSENPALNASNPPKLEKAKSEIFDIDCCRHRKPLTRSASMRTIQRKCSRSSIDLQLLAISEKEELDGFEIPEFNYNFAPLPLGDTIDESSAWVDSFDMDAFAFGDTSCTSVSSSVSTLNPEIEIAELDKEFGLWDEEFILEDLNLP